MKCTLPKLKTYITQKKNNLPFYFVLATFILAAPFAALAEGNFQGSLKGVSITPANATNLPPVANFIYTQDNGTFTFDASPSSDADGEIATYTWQVGNNAASGKTVTIGLTQLPVNVSLTVTDNSGGVTIINKLVQERPYSYYGYPVTNGIPNHPVGSITGYGDPDVNGIVYTRKATAMANGSINAINLYAHTDGFATAVTAKFCVYNGDTLIGTTTDQTNSGLVSQWSGWIPVTAVNGQSLNYTSGDVLHFGICAYNNTPNRVARDKGATIYDQTYAKYLVWKDSTTIPLTVDWANSSYRGFMTALRVVE